MEVNSGHTCYNTTLAVYVYYFVKHFLTVLLSFVLVLPFGYSQKTVQLKLLPVDQPLEAFAKKINYQAELTDSISVVLELRSILNQLHQQAYLEASVDTLVRQDSLFTALMHIGPAFEWVRLQNGNLDEVFLEQTGFRTRLYREKPFNRAQLEEQLDDLLEYAENHGYPFASVWVDSLRLAPGAIDGQLFMDTGPLVVFDTLNVEGTINLTKSYLKNYLGIRQGQVYDKSKLLEIRERLRELPFVQSKKDPTVSFKDDKAIVNLVLEKKKASRFDFLIGVLPNSAQTGRLLITGTFMGEMQNQFGLGERIFASFEQLRPQTQELDLQFNYPYILDLPFGVDLAFDLYRRDTNYINIEFNFGIQYLMEGGNYVKAFWDNRTTNLLTVDTFEVQQFNRLPDTLDVSNSTFGLEYVYKKLDYRFNPRKGWGVSLLGGAGVKTIRRNANIESLVEGAALYDSLTLRTFQYRAEAEIEGYFPLFQRSTLKASLRGGAIIAERAIFANEQYRIGGNQLLRGFDEESIFATQFAIATLEYRLLLGQNSYLYSFLDYAYVDAKTANLTENTVDYPYGFGFGISFETRAGVFGINLAYGSQQNNPIDFAAPKVHFGYVSLF
ncbi:MAG: BamA/TamA family outer membrane protein [Bacteroidota bacterium]